MRPDVIRDRVMARSTLVPLKDPAFRILNSLQECRPDIQLDALALTLAVMSRGAGIDPHDLVTRANRQIVDADRVRSPHLEAIQDYAAGELRK